MTNLQTETLQAAALRAESPQKESLQTEALQTAPLQTGTLRPGSLTLGEHPPKPRLTLRVGITGHRPKPGRLPQDSFGFVTNRLKQVFKAIDVALGGLAEKHKEHFDGAPKVRLVSGLAEGADQLALAAKPEAWALDAVLPFPRNEYLKDFQSPLLGDAEAAVASFEAALQQADTTLQLPIESFGFHGDEAAGPVGVAREAAYVRLGGFLLRQIDVLVAVWDSWAVDGRGGTGDVVRAALAAGIPTIWIHPTRDGIARMIDRIDEQGRIDAPDADCTQDALREAIETLVGLPKPPASSCAPSETTSLAERLRDYAAERWPKPSRWIVYDAFRRWAEGKTLRGRIISDPDEYRARWAPAPEQVPAAGPLLGRLEHMLLPRYAWAEALATAYSHRYRSAYFICYTLAAMAVAVALCGVFVHDTDDHQHALNVKTLLVGFEIAVIGCVLAIVRLGRRERWKEKWIEYRCLAELLLNARFLAFVGEHGRVHGIVGAGAANQWVLWYLRATIREIGLPSASLNGTYQRAVLGALQGHVVAPQQEWHSKNATALHRMDQWLHDFCDRCFFLTLLLLGTFLLARFVQYGCMLWGDHTAADELAAALLGTKSLLTCLAALLPAIGAAVAGVRETGDFGKVAERSAKTVAALDDMSEAIKKARSTLTLEETGDMLLTTAQVLTQDLAAWQSVYGHKRLELPA